MDDSDSRLSAASLSLLNAEPGDTVSNMTHRETLSFSQSPDSRMMQEISGQY